MIRRHVGGTSASTNFAKPAGSCGLSSDAAVPDSGAGHWRGDRNVLFGSQKTFV